MTTHSSLRLALEPGSDDRRIAGRLYDERGERHDFSSWLGLLTLLEHARVRANSPTVDAPHRDAGVATDNKPREDS
jgi:hypothetical protein